ncbi:MAG: hypothetical protein ACKVU1_18160 [bacterium]
MNDAPGAGNAGAIIARWQRTAVLVAAAGAALCVVGVFVDATQFFRSYLVGYLYWLGIALGCLGVGLLHNMTGGAWGRVTSSFVNAAVKTLPLLALLFVPIALGFGRLYSWSDPAVVAADELLRHKSAYLNVPATLARAVAYFAIWIGFGIILSRAAGKSKAHAPADVAAARRTKLLSAPGIVLYVLTMTFASIDWAMSLDPHWFSTIYGVLFIVGQALSAFGLLILMLAAFRDEPPFAGAITQDHFHDLGNLLFAFVLLWAYASISQLLIIWSANLPEEIPWYIKRFNGGWQFIGLGLVIFHFVIPFFILLSRIAKRRAVIIARVAVAILVVHYLDIFWIVAPEFHPKGLKIHWLDFATFAALGGVWFAFYLRQLGAQPLAIAIEAGAVPAGAHGDGRAPSAEASHAR